MIFVRTELINGAAGAGPLADSDPVEPKIEQLLNYVQPHMPCPIPDEFVEMLRVYGGTQFKYNVYSYTMEPYVHKKYGAIDEFPAGDILPVELVHIKMEAALSDTKMPPLLWFATNAYSDAFAMWCGEEKTKADYFKYGAVYVFPAQMYPGYEEEDVNINPPWKHLLVGHTLQDFFDRLKFHEYDEDGQ